MTISNFLTVKELAKLAGVSTQSVYKKLHNLLQPYVQLVNNRKMIEYRALKEVYGKEVEQPIQPKVANLYNQNATLYDVLKAELEAKNQQISDMQEQIANAQDELMKEREHSRNQSDKISQFVDQSQILQLAQLSKDKSLELNGRSDYEYQEATPKKKGLFSKIFGKEKID